METAQEKYENDLEFKNLVDMIYSMILRCDFTPSELREAAIFASIKYEMEHTRWTIKDGSFDDPNTWVNPWRRERP